MLVIKIKKEHLTCAVMSEQHEDLAFVHRKRHFSKSLHPWNNKIDINIKYNRMLIITL